MFLFSLQEQGHLQRTLAEGTPIVPPTAWTVTPPNTPDTNRDRGSKDPGPQLIPIDDLLPGGSGGGNGPADGLDQELPGT